MQFRALLVENNIELTAAFSLASFFLFVAVMPLVFAPETLPEKKMELRRLRKFVDDAKKILNDLLIKYPDVILLPEDAAVERNDERLDCQFDEMDNNPFLDIGPKTTERYVKIIKGSAVVFANGPMGYFEKEVFANGTSDVLNAIADCKGITVVGGGHMGAMAKKMKLDDRITHISTGGGATINFLTGKKLDLVVALEDAALRMKN